MQTTKEKEKSTAVLLAALFGPFAFLYSFKDDRWRFAICMAATILSQGVLYLAAWAWAIVSIVNRPADYYGDYYQDKWVDDLDLDFKKNSEEKRREYLIERIRHYHKDVIESPRKLKRRKTLKTVSSFLALVILGSILLAFMLIVPQESRGPLEAVSTRQFCLAWALFTVIVTIISHIRATIELKRSLRSVEAKRDQWIEELKSQFPDYLEKLGGVNSFLLHLED
jgi:hypothetical protein